MLVALAIVDGDGALAEVEVFDAQAHAFHDAQAGTVHEQGGKLPGDIEVGDIMCQNVNGTHGLAELPVVKVCGAAKGVEEGGGGGGGTIATGLGPGFGPLDVILVGGGLDGQLDEALEEMLAGLGECLPVRRNGRWRGHAWNIICSLEQCKGKVEKFREIGSVGQSHRWMDDNLAGHGLKSVRQDAAHSRQDAGAPHFHLSPSLDIIRSKLPCDIIATSVFIFAIRTTRPNCNMIPFYREYI